MDWLKRPFQEKEVHQALLSMDGDKISGPDGFTIAFFQSCWAIVKDDLIHYCLFPSQVHTESRVSASPVATVRANVYPMEASASQASLAVVCVSPEVAPVKDDCILASEKRLLCRGF